MDKTIIKGLDIRPWRPGDEHDICALFESSFGRTMGLEFWRWRFAMHPAGDPLVMLAWDGDQLVAHYGASQAPLLVDNEVVRSALSMTTMTQPDYRGRGLVELLGEALYARLAADGFAAAWGFPNAMINATRRRKLSWDPVCDVATLSMPVTSLREAKADPHLQVNRLDKVDRRFGELTRSISRPDEICGLRDADVLAWRIDQNPMNHYTRWVIEEGPDLTGYAITKTYGQSDMDIVDLCAVGARQTASLLSAIGGAAKSKGVKQLNTWVLPNAPTRIAVERFGFAVTAPVTYLGGRALNNAIGDLTDSRRWRVSMLESDLY